MRAEGFPPGDLDALVSYLRSLGLPPNPFASPDGSLTQVQERGRVLFEREQRKDGKPIVQRDRCSFCHPGPRHTNRRTFDVSTKGSRDTTGVVDTPQLENLFMTRPFLHDGRCATLEEVFTLENPADKHGVANDLGKDELNDLVEFMKTLGPRRAPRSVTGAGTKAHLSSPRGRS
jgi:cytochrome c peroxidase